MDNQLTCKKCNSVLNNNDKFCSSCGIAIIREKKCSSCSFINEPASKFCSNCGKGLINNPVQEPEKEFVKIDFDNNNTIPHLEQEIISQEKKIIKTWYYDDRGSNEGPFTESDIKNLIVNGKIDKNTLISNDNCKSWKWVKDFFDIDILNFEKINAKELETAKSWYYNYNGQKKGPFTESEMIRNINTGVIKRGELVFKDGNVNWVPIENSTLGHHIHTPPPLVGDAVSNGTIWWVAFAPLISFILTIVILNFAWEQYIATEKADWLQLYKFVSDWNVIIYIIINLIFVSIDSRKLQNAGHDTSKFGAIFLIPVYIWKRNKMLQKTQFSFILWIFFSFNDFFLQVLLF